MKIKVAILGMAVTCIAGSVMAQETDDMYFNSKDRAKLNAAKPQKTETLAYADETRNQERSATTSADDDINATDYSARNVNPEFTSRSNSTLAQEDNGDYFINDYRFATANELNQFNNNYNNWTNSQWYNSGYYANSMYAGGMYAGGLNSSYYYNPYANPWGDPYYTSGWSGSLSYYGGCPYYGNSWSMGIGYGSPYYGGYYGNGSYYGGGYYGGGYYGGGYYGGGYYGGGNTVVIVEGGRGSIYGKRPDRGGMAYHADGNAPSRRNQVSTRPASTSQGSNSGRVATSNSGRTQDEYYNRSWRRASEYQRTSTSSGSNTNSSWSNSGNSNSRSWGNSSGNTTSSPSYTPPSRSSSFDTGGSRSSGGSSAGSSSGSGSGGRTRGRD